MDSQARPVLDRPALAPRTIRFCREGSAFHARRLTVRVAELQPQVEADTVFQAAHFAWVQQTASSVQAGLVNGMQIGRIDIALVVTGEASFAVYAYVSARRSLSPGYQRDRYSAQPSNQGTDSEHDDRMIASVRKMRIPHLATQRLHGQPTSAGMTASGNGAGRPP